MRSQPPSGQYPACLKKSLRIFLGLCHLPKLSGKIRFISSVLIAMSAQDNAGPSFSNALAASEASTFEHRLLARYASVKEMRAEVSQIKSGEFLAAPLKSTARMSWSKEKVVWTNLTPVPSEIEITLDHVVITKPDGSKMNFSSPSSTTARNSFSDLGNSATSQIHPQQREAQPQKAVGLGAPAGAGQMMAQLTQFLARLFALDMQALRKDFVIETRGFAVVAKKRPDSDFSLFNSFELAFRDNLEIESLLLSHPSGQTVMQFSHVSVK